MMKHLFLLLWLLTVTLDTATGQEKQQGEPVNTKQHRFWVGFSYSYVHTDMKLYSCIEHSVWQGLDYGADTLSSNDLSSINSNTRFTSEDQVLAVEAGMDLFNRPSSKWHIDGKLILGLARTKYTTYDRERDVNDLVLTSPFSRICAGFEFRFGYAFNQHWGLNATPLLTFTQGATTRIDDKLNGPLLNFSDDRKVTSQTVMARVNIMAGYRTGRFNFSAGPGFYLAYNYREYNIKMTNTDDGSTYNTETRSVFYNKSFVDASLKIEWKIISLLEANLYCAIGKDIVITPGIKYLF